MKCSVMLSDQGDDRIAPLSAAIRTRPSLWTSAAEGDADTRAGALHAVQRLLAGSRLFVQTEPSGGVARNEDFGQRPAVHVLAEGAVN